jgi:DNA polymerase III subunit gamma/tau
LARVFAPAGDAPELDIYEIDAASNRGIDDVRELKEAVYTLPYESPFKVYIIDEVHMLTKEAFNALLKTLEEPPAHVIFILATTEEEKLLDTIISRCQVFRFNSPSRSVLSKLSV